MAALVIAIAMSALLGAPRTDRVQGPGDVPHVVVVVDLPRRIGSVNPGVLADAIRHLPADRISALYVLTEDGVVAGSAQTVLSAIESRITSQPGRLSPEEAAWIVRGNQQIRDQVIFRACRSQAAGCGPSVHAEAVALLEAVDASAAARLRALAAVPADPPERLILVTSGLMYRDVPAATLNAALSRLMKAAIVQAVRSEPARSGAPLEDALAWLAARARVEIVPADRVAGLSFIPSAPVSSAASAPGDAIPASVRRYVARFERTMRFVVAQERYEQTVRSRRSSINLPRTHPGIIVEQRTTESAVALLDLADDVWMMTRQVASVDGHPVASQAQPLADAATEAKAIEELKRTANDAARWNIGTRRNINTPTLALWLFTARLAPRFRVTPAGSERLDGRKTTVLRFIEVGRPPMLQIDGESTPSSGRIWADVDSGAVAKTELVLERRSRANPGVAIARSVTTVTYAPLAALECWVPVEMRESYVFPASPDSLTTRATYSNYRRFTVDTRIKR